MTGIRSACFTIVQLQSGDAEFSGSYSIRDSGEDEAHSVRFSLGDLPDATDLQMWVQMALATACDGI